MTEIAGLLIGISLMRLAAPRDALLRAAIVAQAADLTTFAIAWHEGQGERNPISRLMLDLSFAVFSPAEWLAVAVAGLGLLGLKVVLVTFLVGVAPHLGRYARIVLIVAIGAGALGAASNVLAYANAAVAMPILAAFLLVAVRWPSRFGDALGVTVRFVISACLAIAGVAAFVSASLPYLCGGVPCPPGVAPLLIALAVTCFVGAAFVFLLTARFTFRMLSRGPA
jgi:hypothetical protein